MIAQRLEHASIISGTELARFISPVPCIGPIKILLDLVLVGSIYTGKDMDMLVAKQISALASYLCLSAPSTSLLSVSVQ